jgi:gamma-glutamyltranspeptidase/glutathione hydrolase
MVASSQVFASEAGLEVLRDGGTAADACVAMDAVLNVTEPPSTSLGGDMFALFYEAATGRITALNGSGRAPRGLSLDLLRSQRISEVPERHPYTITVPGVCAGWFDLVERHGSMPVSRLLAPAIRWAEEGFPVAPATAALWTRRLDPRRSHELAVHGRAPRAGETFRNHGLARALRAIAEGGKEVFYRGEIAGAIVRAVQDAGGVMGPDDLATHETTYGAPISTSYRGARVWECPPNGQGLTALLALNILEGFRPDAFGEVDRWHRQVEAMRLAFSDTRWYLADPHFADVPVEALLSREYAERRRALIRRERAAVDAQRGSPVAASGTVYLCAVDEGGNACSYVSSNYLAFGTGIVPGGWGFTLQNRGHNFALDPEHPNALAPGKRPYHTIIPGMLATADGELWGPFGVMGGFMQPQGHVQVVTALVDDAADPQAALDRPRFCLEPASAGGRVLLETGVPRAVARGLRVRGHEVVEDVPSFGRSTFGRGQIITRDAEGRLWGGSDVRADGCALGF